MSQKGVARRAAVGCLVVAIVAMVAFGVWGDFRAGAAIAIGLALGSLNGLAAERAFSIGLSVRLSSLPRLGLLSAAILGVGFALGLSYVWLAAIGAGAAQLVLAAFAARTLLAR